MTDFQAIVNEAKAAGNVAAQAQNAKLGDERSRGFDCGFAWVAGIDGRSPFGKFLKTSGIGSKGYPKGMQIWYSHTHDEPTQSISVHEAGCRAYLAVLEAHGITGLYVGQRLD